MTATSPRPSAWPIEPPGVWIEVRVPSAKAPRAALFLDRDGVLIVDKVRLADPAQIEMSPGAIELVAAANRAGLIVAVVTNQSGIDRKLFGWADFAAMDREIARHLATGGGRIDALAACPFHPDFTANYGPRQAVWRKPGDAMINALARRLNVDRARSWFIGDQPTDIDAATAAGIGHPVLLGQDVPTLAEAAAWMRREGAL